MEIKEKKKYNKKNEQTRQRPQRSWDIYFSDFSMMCPLSKNEWSLKKVSL